MPKMPVIDSIAPITPNTPSAIVAMREANRAASSVPGSRLDVNGQPRIQLRTVLLIACRQLLRIAVRAHHQRGRAGGDCRTGRNMPAVDLRSGLHIFRLRQCPPPGCAFHPAACKYPPNRVGDRAKDSAGKFPIHYRYARRVFVVMPGESLCLPAKLCRPPGSIREIRCT